MAGDYARWAAALGAGALGFEKGAALKQQRDDAREERAWKREDRAREQAYRDEQSNLISSGMQEMTAAGDDANAKRLALMRMYEQRGLLDAKYGKGSMSDMEQVRKSVDDMKGEGMLQAYTQFMQTGDARAAGEIFNQYGKKKVNLDSLQGVEAKEPMTGQPVSIIRGTYEDGSSFTYNPYAEATRMGGVVGIMGALKDKAAREQKQAETQANYDQQIKVVNAQGANALRTAHVAAANGAGALDLQRQKYGDERKQQIELESLQTRLADAQEKGDEKRAKDLITQIQIKTGRYGKGAAADTKRYQTNVVDGQAVTTDTLTGEQWAVDPSSLNKGRPATPSAAAGQRMTQDQAWEQAATRVKAGYPVEAINAALSKAGYKPLPTR